MEVNANTVETKASIAEAYDSYAKWTDDVAQYPVTAEACYLALGLTDECGELQRAADNADPNAVLAEVGDVLWYAARYSTNVLGLRFSEVISKTQIQHRFSLTGPRNLLVNIAIISGIEKKRMRDGETWDENKRILKNADAYNSLREVLSWVFAKLYLSGYLVVDALNANQKKLSKRLDEGKIKGDGDYR
jgi:phosphoribosyl-ATP pyrophosphohydrolase